MLRVFVDSGSSIKQSEKEKLNVEIIPLRYYFGENEYQDDIDLDIDQFYDILINQKQFPKTSLPYLDVLEEKVNKYTTEGDEVIIITISSKISGTFSAIQSLFVDNKSISVVDSLSAIGGIRLLVEEINKNRDKTREEILQKVYDLIPRIKIYAIPETLNYLLRGGRLSKKEWLLGSVLNVKPIISLVNGSVVVSAKKIGIRNSMHFIATELAKTVDKSYPIIASYTYNPKNLKTLIDLTKEEYRGLMSEYDNLDPVIACHWGPNSFGYIYIAKKGVTNE